MGSQVEDMVDPSNEEECPDARVFDEKLREEEDVDMLSKDIVSCTLKAIRYKMVEWVQKVF